MQYAGEGCLACSDRARQRRRQHSQDGRPPHRQVEAVRVALAGALRGRRRGASARQDATARQEAAAAECKAQGPQDDGQRDAAERDALERPTISRRSRPSASGAASSRAWGQLQKAIRDYLDQHNAEPKPFVWTKPADSILANEARALSQLRIIKGGNQALESEH